jgi:AraC family transcriptional regulator of adaptative response/methylated-DNA-[protein]-cysteine methyltransferase
MIVAATEGGICLIEFSDTPEEVHERLPAHFPAAKLDADVPGFATWVQQVLEFIEAPRQGLNLPLDIQGTAFQRQVWQALQTIPAGETTTYTEIAKQIGKPSAVRAVATACAANRIAVVIPCHRVLRSDGSLSGYRWGVERKAKLLQRESEG